MYVRTCVYISMYRVQRLLLIFDICQEERDYNYILRRLYIVVARQ